MCPGFTAGLCSVPLIWSLLSLPVPHGFDCCSSVVLFGVCPGYASSFVLFPQDACQFCVFCGSIYFGIICSNFVKSHGWFDRDSLKSVDCIEYFGHFNCISSSNLRAWDIFPFPWITFSFMMMVRLIPRFFVFFFLWDFKCFFVVVFYFTIFHLFSIKKCKTFPCINVSCCLAKFIYQF